MKVIIDGVRYIPRDDNLKLVDSRFKEALERLVQIQCYHDCTHKHQSWAWDALNALSPKLAQISSDNPQKALKMIKEEEIAATDEGMRYGVIIEDLACMHVGIAVKIKSVGDDFYILDESEHSLEHGLGHAYLKSSIKLIDKNTFDFFKGKTEGIRRFLLDSDKPI